MPWNAVGYFTMWLQTLGFSDMPAAALTALFWGGTALGNLLGGIVGDLLAKRLPNVGRQLTCQVSTLNFHTIACALHSLLSSARPSAWRCHHISPRLFRRPFKCHQGAIDICLPECSHQTASLGDLGKMCTVWLFTGPLPMQVSIAVGLPLVAILIKALPERGGAQGSMDPLTGGYGVLLFLLGSVISWPQTQNSAMFSEVRPFVVFIHDTF